MSFTQYIDSPNQADWGYQSDGFFYIPTINAARTAMVARFDQLAGTDTPANESSPIFTLFSAIAEVGIVSSYQAVGGAIDALDPQNAKGDQLDAVARRLFVFREAAAPSTVTLTLTGTAGVTIGAGSLFADPTGTYQFSLDAAATIGGGGTVHAAATCTQDGPFAPATITRIVNPVVGLSAVAIKAGTTVSPGQYIETDADLRLRLPYAAWSIGAGTQDAVKAALLNIPGVEKAKVWLKLSSLQNPPDAPLGSMAPVIYPSVSSDLVAPVMFMQLVGGCFQYGSTSVTYTNPSTGSQRVISYTVASTVTVSVTVSSIVTDGTQAATYLTDIYTAIEAYLDAREIGDTVFYGKILAIVLGTTGVLSATVVIKKGAGSFGTSNLSFDFDQLPVVGTILVS